MTNSPEKKRHPRQYKFYDIILGAFVTILLCSNLIGAAKVCQVGGFTFGAGIFFFPLSYLFGDIMTEVYGYARARKIVWTGFGALAFASLMAASVVAMPPAPGWLNQEAYEIAFGSTWRIVGASLLAFWAGELTNSYTLAKIKVFTKGRFLWLRTIGSTIAGEGVDSLIFYPIAFGGLWETKLVITVMLTNYSLKVLWEAVATPLTYVVVNKLKQIENEDYFDDRTDFNPFTIQV